MKIIIAEAIFENKRFCRKFVSFDRDVLIAEISRFYQVEFVKNGDDNFPYFTDGGFRFTKDVNGSTLTVVGHLYDIIVKSDDNVAAEIIKSVLSSVPQELQKTTIKNALSELGISLTKEEKLLFRKEALVLAASGKKITHESFKYDEFLFDEDGYIFASDNFFIRREFFFGEEFENGWSIYNKD